VNERLNGILSAPDIMDHLNRGRLEIDPLDPALIRPASICLRLGASYMRPQYSGTVDVADRTTYPTCQAVALERGETVEVPSGGLVLINTLERVHLPREVVGWVGNTSGLARLGLLVVLSHLVSPGFGEAGLSTLTLEVVNMSPVGVKLHQGQRICHLVLAALSSLTDRGYDSQVGTYAGQCEPLCSRFFEDFEV